MIVATVYLCPFYVMPPDRIAIDSKSSVKPMLGIQSSARDTALTCQRLSNHHRSFGLM